MKTFGFCRLALFAAIIVASVMSVASAPSMADGKSLFLANKCTNCHSVTAAGIARTGTAPAANAKTPPDLSTVGDHRTAAFIVKFLQKEESINGRKHLLKFKGTDAELSLVASWLVGLKGSH